MGRREGARIGARKSSGPPEVPARRGSTPGPSSWRPVRLAVGSRLTVAPSGWAASATGPNERSSPRRPASPTSPAPVTTTCRRRGARSRTCPCEAAAALPGGHAGRGRGSTTRRRARMCLLPPLNIEAGCAPTSPARRSARSATPPRAPNFFTMADGTCEARQKLGDFGSTRRACLGSATTGRRRGCGVAAAAAASSPTARSCRRACASRTWGDTAADAAAAAAPPPLQPRPAPPHPTMSACSRSRSRSRTRPRPRSRPRSRSSYTYGLPTLTHYSNNLLLLLLLLLLLATTTTTSYYYYY